MATMPHFDVPSTLTKPGPWVVLPINASSDGDPETLRDPPYRAISNDSYRIKIGAMWAEKKGIATDGESALPHPWSGSCPSHGGIRPMIHPVLQVAV